MGRYFYENKRPSLKSEGLFFPKPEEKNKHRMHNNSYELSSKSNHIDLDRNQITYYKIQALVDNAQVLLIFSKQIVVSSRLKVLRETRGRNNIGFMRPADDINFGL